MAGLGGVTIVTAIVAFSLGVELGHQFVVIPLYTARIVVRRAAGCSCRGRLKRPHFLGFGPHRHRRRVLCDRLSIPFRLEQDKAR